MSAHPTLTPLHEYLVSHPSADRRLLLRQVADELADLHSQARVVHGDVKMTSVFVDEHGKAHLPRSRATAAITSQPKIPASPEERLPMTTATDVYAFGWLVFHIYTDIDPQELARDPKMMSLIASGVKPNRPGPGTIPVLRGLDNPIWDAMTRCWEFHPASHPSMDEILRAFGPPTAPPPGLNGEVPRIFYPADLRYFWTDMGPAPFPYVLELSESPEDAEHVIPLELASFWRV